MLGYSRAKTALEDAKELAPADVIQRFIEIEQTWGGKRSQDEDITFVVIRVTNGKANAS